MRAPLARDESGVTLPELLITSLILSLVVAMMLTLFAVTQRTEASTTRDSRTLAVLRVGMSRLTKELRQARVVYAGSDSDTIRVWVDYDRDNQQDAVERITWELTPSGSGAVLSRQAGIDPPTYHGTEFVYGAVFSYNLPPPATTTVDVTLTADVNPALSPNTRTQTTIVRLRNAAA